MKACSMWAVVAIMAGLLTSLWGGVAEAGLADSSVELAPHLRESSRALWPSRLTATQEAVLSGQAAPSHLDVLVVGCDFSDSLMWGRDLDDFPGWPEQTRRGHLIPGLEVFQFAAHDSAYFSVQMQKVSDYFETVSFGAFSMDWTVHPVIVNLPRPMGYYGDVDSTDVRQVQMAREVLDAVDPQIDFSRFDTVVLIHAGAGQETDILGDSPEQLISNYLDRRDFEDAHEAGALPEPRLTTDEGDVEHVLVLPESESQDPVPSAGINGFFGTRGVYCFEFGLRLGMLSLADFTPSPFPDSQGIGNFGLMGYGLFTGLGIVPAAPCAMNRMLMGWVQPVEVRDDASMRIAAMDAAGHAVGDTLLVKVPITDREYFLLEYRLQDPDGDLFFTFDNLNSTPFPDYFDEDSDFGDGTPTTPFDPLTDTWESTAGAEWDWFMSENSARSEDRCQRAGGSGLYIWHIDERVIQESILNSSNTINADPRHKGVDVEEADGIQDLDSGLPSQFFLGWDGDTWRGEGASTFGPNTVPSSDSADGFPTGITIADISSVVVDSLSRDEDGFCTGFVYRPALTFEVTFDEPVAPVLETLAVRRQESSPGLFDVRVVDLGTSAVDPNPDGILEIVQAGADGRLYAFHADLTEWHDGDMDPATQGVLATGPGEWLGPPAIADVDGDGAMEIALTAADGVYLYGFDGTPERVAPGPVGLLWTPSEGELVGPPVLTPLVFERHAQRGPDARCEILVAHRVNENSSRLHRLTWFMSELSAERRNLDGRIHDAPVVSFTEPTDVVAAVALQRENGAVLRGENLRLRTGAGTVSLPSGPSTGLLAFDFLAPLSFSWVDTAGRVLHVPELDDEVLVGAVSSRPTGPWSTPVGARRSADGQPVLAYAVDGRLYAVERTLAVVDEFPYEPRYRGVDALGANPPSPPVLVDLTGDGTVEILWADAVGRIHAVGLDGRSLAGWPLQGPAEPMGSPAVADLDADGTLELVVAGAFGRLVSIDGPNESIEVDRRGELRVYNLNVPSSSYAPWTTGRGDALNRGHQAQSATSSLVRAGSVLESDSLFLQPNPVLGSQLRVRARANRPTEVLVTIHTIEGEVATSLGPVAVVGAGLVDLTISVDGLASGLYLCRVEAAGDRLAGVFTIAR